MHHLHTHKISPVCKLLSHSAAQPSVTGNATEVASSCDVDLSGHRTGRTTNGQQSYRQASETIAYLGFGGSAGEIT